MILEIFIISLIIAEGLVENFYDQPKKSKWWLWLLIIVLLGGLGYGGYWYYKNKYQAKTTSSTNETTETKIPENWTRAEKMVMAKVTSGCTIKLDNGSFRMFYMNEGKIVFADSTDALSFGTPVPTGVTEDSGKMISNPAVLKLKDNSWIMVYEQSPLKTPGSQDKTPPGPNTQRNLYLATSVDGKVYSKTGIAIDSAKDDKYFASVPDLVLTPDGKIRMYYVSGGDATGSVVSTNNGKTWNREAGYRITGNAVDADVLYQTKNGKTSWIMYYTILSPANNSINKATSEDGINWTSGEAVIKPAKSGNSVIDPDVVELSAGKYRMFFGEASGDSTQGGASINLYYADSSGDLF